ncbi:uncharacterized protein ACJ7VT_021411 [Polymixia lowei]
MARLTSKLAFVICSVGLTFCAAQQTARSQRNVSCAEILKKDGYHYAITAPNGAEIEASYHQTMIAHRNKEGNWTTGHEVKTTLYNSIITSQCLNLTLKCIIPDNDLIKEEFLDYIVTDDITAYEENKREIEASTQPWGIIVLSVAGAIIIIIIIIGTAVCYCCIYKPWTSQQREHQRPVTWLRFMNDLVSRCRSRDAISRAERGEGGGSSGGIRAVQQKIHLESSLLNGYGISEADGRTHEVVKVDHSMRGTLQSNEVASQCDRGPSDLKSNAALTQRAMNRNHRGDPGGLIQGCSRRNGNNGSDVNKTRETFDDVAPGEQGRGGHQNDGQRLLSNNGTTLRDFDMTAEAIPLVNKHGPDQVVEHPIAPDKGSSGVESAGRKQNQSF